MKTIAIIGCGSALDNYWALSSCETKERVRGIFDNQPRFRKFQNLPVRKTADLSIMHGQFDVFMITSSYFLEIYQQLIDLGIPESKIRVYSYLIT